MHPVRLAISALLLIAVEGVYASDWQYAGFTKIERVDTYLFYDAESVQRPSKDMARYWVKAMTRSSLDGYFKKHEKELIDKTAKKIAVYYVPRLMQLDAISKQYKDNDAFVSATIEITGYEIVANSLDTSARTKLYYEIDCKERKSRVLDLILYTPNGDVAKRAGAPQTNFQFDVPDSNGDWQAQVICPQSPSR